MLGIGWTTFNLVLSGFFIPYKVRQPGVLLPPVPSLACAAIPALDAPVSSHAGASSSTTWGSGYTLC